MTFGQNLAKMSKNQDFSWSWISINHHSRFVNHCICSGVWSMLNTLVCWGGVMAADSDNEMRDFTDSEGEQEVNAGKRRRVQGPVSGLSKSRPFYAPNIFARVICLWNVCFLWLFRSPQTTLDRSLRVLPRLPRCLERFLSRLSDCLRNDLYNVEPLKKTSIGFFTLKNS